MKITKFWLNTLMIGLLFPQIINCTGGKKHANNVNNMNTIELTRKRILLDSSKVLFDKPLSPDDFSNGWTVHHSKWAVKDGWLEGENNGNWPGMAILNQDFPGNVLVEFEAQTILPSTHDINVMWNGEWLSETDKRGIAYVAGLQGWWTGKVGIEKSDEYKFMVGTSLFNFEPGKIYKIQAGSIDGHCFILANGKLLLEAMDPDPIDNQKHAKVGFEAYCSKIRIRNIKIRQIHWVPIEMKYEPEF
jgi:hypothetical protein